MGPLRCPMGGAVWAGVIWGLALLCEHVHLDPGDVVAVPSLRGSCILTLQGYARSPPPPSRCRCHKVSGAGAGPRPPGHTPLQSSLQGTEAGVQPPRAWAGWDGGQGQGRPPARLTPGTLGRGPAGGAGSSPRTRSCLCRPCPSGLLWAPPPALSLKEEGKRKGATRFPRPSFPGDAAFLDLSPGRGAGSDAVRHRQGFRQGRGHTFCTALSALAAFGRRDS